MTPVRSSRPSRSRRARRSRRNSGPRPFPHGSGLTSRIIDTKQPLILGSFQEICGAGAILSPNEPGDELMPQSYMGVPIIIGEKVLGVIDVQSYQEHVYDDSQVFYDAGVHLQSSERGRNDTSRAGFTVRLPANRPFRGAHLIGTKI